MHRRSFLQALVVAPIAAATSWLTMAPPKKAVPFHKGGNYMYPKYKEALFEASDLVWKASPSNLNPIVIYRGGETLKVTERGGVFIALEDHKK